MAYEKKKYYRTEEMRFIGGVYTLRVCEKYSRPGGKWFETPAESTADFLAVRGKAKIKAEEIIKEYKALKGRLGFNVGYTYDGDTHGIHSEYQYISFQLDGYFFMVEDRDD